MDLFYLPIRTLTGPQGEDPERAESREYASAIRRIEQVLGCSAVLIASDLF